MSRTACVLLALMPISAWPAHAAPPSGAPGTGPLAEAQRRIEALDLDGAERVLADAPASLRTRPDGRFLLALLAFHRGQYAVAAREGRAARDELGARGASMQTMVDLFAATERVTRGLTAATSPDGRYVVLHDPARDAPLVPYAIETLARMEEVLERELGARVPGPIRLEIYASPEALAEVSTLSVEDIHRTGTIALCKWDRLMLTSPRALLRGYPWRDTVAHELVHLVLARATADRAPVWVQEGVAKSFERSWRPSARRDATLDEASRALLSEAAGQNELLPFDRLHPSIARLPSQRDAALAFAQVATFVDRFRETAPPRSLRRVVEALRAGSDARAAFGTAAGAPFATLERQWRAALSASPRERGPSPRIRPLRFRTDEADPRADESASVETERARTHLRLGDLLWDRRRPRAAAEEYRRAFEAAPDDPVLAARLAQAALAAGEAQQVIDTLAGMRDRYRDHEPTRALLASAHRLLGHVEEARWEATEAIALNPFDPAPHCDLAAVVEDAERRAQETSFCASLGGTP